MFNPKQSDAGKSAYRTYKEEETRLQSSSSPKRDDPPGQDLANLVEAVPLAMPKPPKVLASVEEELTELNLALERAGLRFRAKDLGELQQAKRAAGIGNTLRPVADFDGLVDRLKDALKLGAFDDVDGDPGRKQVFANELKQALIKEVPSRKKRLNAQSLTFEDCLAMCEAVTEEAMFGLTPGALARKIGDRIGHGNLAGIFPGESEEATTEQGGQDRLDKMVDLGADVVNYLKQVGDVSPELTGSIVLIGGGYEGIPEDLDINVTTKGTPEERKEVWETVVDYMNQYDGMSVPIKGGSIRVFPMTAGKIQGENAAIWERRYGYVIKVGGQEGKVMPFEVEVKDVGGSVWKEHLLEGADARGTDESGASQPQWLLVDTMTRILGHRKAMKESAMVPNLDYLEDTPKEKRAQRWVEIVAQEGLDKSVGKRLWEKLNVSANMAGKNPTIAKKGLNKWLAKQVKDAPAYLELLDKADNETAYEEWLTDIDPPALDPGGAEVIDEQAALESFQRKAPTTVGGWVSTDVNEVAALLRTDAVKAGAIQLALSQCLGVARFDRLEDVDVKVEGSFDRWSQLLTEAVTKALEDAIAALNIKISTGLPPYAQQALAAAAKGFSEDLAARKRILAETELLKARFLELGGKAEKSATQRRLEAIAKLMSFLEKNEKEKAWALDAPVLLGLCTTLREAVNGDEEGKIRVAAEKLIEAGGKLKISLRGQFKIEGGTVIAAEFDVG
jgi:hypothetical protein